MAAEPIVIVSWRILVHPFGDQCEESRGFSSVDSGVCEDIQSIYEACEQGEIFDWSSQKCTDICPESLVWLRGACVPRDSVPMILPENCTDVSHTILANSYAGNYTDLIYSDSGVRLVLGNSSHICVSCSWISVTESGIDKDEASVTLTGTDLKFEPPLYWTDGTNYSLCLEDSIVSNRSTNTSPTLLGKICFWVEEKASVITTSISMACLMVMVVAYSVLPNLHNIPGRLVLGQIGRAHV